MAIQEKGKRVFYIPASNENPHPQLVDVLRVHDDGKTYGLYEANHGRTLRRSAQLPTPSSLGHLPGH